MTERGFEFEEAVKEAQALGFAEADPSSDVQGDDAAYKLTILSTIAFGQRVHVGDIPKEGITKISKEDISYAKELGYNVKLLASAVKNQDEIELRVHPALIPADHPLAKVKNEFNAVLLKGNAVGTTMLYGKGAGSLPTGSAILGDVITIAKNIDSPVVNEVIGAGNLKIVNKAYKKYYIRIEVIDKPGVLGGISNIFGENNISIFSVVQRQKNGNETVPLVFITHDVERKNIDAALEKIKLNEDVVDIASIIMVENFK
jgi:homoserine dehydrogenase